MVHADKTGVSHFKKMRQSAGRKGSSVTLPIIYPHFLSVVILRVMPPKSRARAKLTAAQLAEPDVVDLCSSSSDDEVEVADPHAALEPLVELPCLQPAHCADQEAGMGPHEAGIEFILYIYFLCCS